MFGKKKEMIHFSGRRHTTQGIISMVIGEAVLIGLLAVSIYSSTSRGNGGIIVGLIGLLLLTLSIIGFTLAYKACKKKDIFYRFPIIGLLINGGLIVTFFVIYILGLL